MLALFAGRHLALAPSAAHSLAAQLDQLRHTHVAAAAAAAPIGRRSYEVDAAGVAVLQLRGVMMPSVPPVLQYLGQVLGQAFTDTAELRAAIAQAVNDPAAQSIRLEIDSPGGDVNGTQALAADVAAAARRKPVAVHVSGMMASAALWVGSQASSINAEPTSKIGSLGSFCVIEDWSGAAAQAGVKVHVISNAKAKGGARGAPVATEHLAQAQAIVNATTALFVADVARGRGMPIEAAAALATGAMWLGAEAKQLGLVDAVGPDSLALSATTGLRAKGATMATVTLPQASVEEMISPEELAMCERHGNSPEAYLKTRAELRARGQARVAAPAEAPGPFGLTAEELAMCERHGNSPAAYAKTKAELAARGHVGR